MGVGESSDTYRNSGLGTGVGLELGLGLGLQLELGLGSRFGSELDRFILNCQSRFRASADALRIVASAEALRIVASAEALRSGVQMS